MDHATIGRVAAVSFVAEAINSLVGLDEYVSTPANVLAINGPTAVLTHCRYILTCHFNFSQTTTDIESLAYKMK